MKTGNIKINFINIFLMLLICLSLIFCLGKNLNLYQQKFDSEKLNRLYLHSQFASQTENRQLIIEDDDLYAYAGWQYLTTGQVDQINIEHPPLGKYLIGLFTLVFKNQNLGQLVLGIIFLLFLYRLGIKTVRNQSLSLLVILLFTQEKLFQEQLTHSLLDLPLGVFLIIFLLGLINQTAKKNNLNLIIAGVSLGTIASIKYPTTALLCWLTMTIYFYLTKEKQMIKKIIILGFTASLVFLLSYLPFFIQHPHLVDFYQLQIRAIKIHLSHVPEYPKLQVFNVLFFNRWLTWWGNKEYVTTEFWNIFWPILTLNFLFSLYQIKKNLLIKIWALIYLIFLALRLFFPRYLFLLLPFFYLQLCYNGSCLWQKIKQKKQ